MDSCQSRALQTPIWACKLASIWSLKRDPYGSQRGPNYHPEIGSARTPNIWSSSNSRPKWIPKDPSPTLAKCDLGQNVHTWGSDLDRRKMSIMQDMAWFRGPIGMREDTTTKYQDVGNEDEFMYEVVIRSGVRSMCVNRPDVMSKLADKLQRRINWGSVIPLWGAIRMRTCWTMIGSWR